MTLFLAPLAGLCCLPAPQEVPASGADWPAFLGPRGDNSIVAAGLAREWGPEGPAVLWTVEIGPGFGGVSVHDGEVFLLDRVTGEGDLLRCFALEDGSERWDAFYEAPGRFSYPGSRGVPTVTAEHVYTIGGFGQVACFERETGQLLWTIDQQQVFDAEPPFFGWCQSPVLFDDLLILAPLTPEVGLAALDRESGALRWSTPGVGRSHSTPVLATLNGRAQVLMISARVTSEQGGQDQTPAQSARAALEQRGGLISSFDPASGEPLWSSFAPACTSPVAPPLVTGPSQILVSGGYRAGTVLLEVTELDGSFTIRELFRHPRGAQVHPAVRWGDHLYLIVNENRNESRARRSAGGLMCLDLDGTELWRTGAEPYFGRGPLLVADGLLILQDGLSGTLHLIEATPTGYHPLAEADLFPLEGRAPPRTRGGRQMWAPLALSHGRLLLRSQEELKCVDLRVLRK